MGLVVFAVSSVLCALAPVGCVLVAARLLQGVGAAFLVPSSLAMLNARFSGAAQARAIGTWTGTAFVIGPLLGGLLVDALNWRWIFGVNLVPLAVTLYLASKLPADEFGARSAGRVDVVGATLNAVGLTGVVYGLIEGQCLGYGSPAVLAALLVGAVCLLAFPLWEHRAAHPMMPLQIFTTRNFAVGNLATVFLYAAVSLGMLIVALFLQETAGLSATQAGLVTLPIPVLSFLLARRFGTLSGRYGPRMFMAAGPLLAAVGFLLPATAHEPVDLWTQMLPGVVVFGLGLAVTVSPLTAAVGRGRPFAERHRVGGQQRGLADRRADRGGACRCDRRGRSRFRRLPPRSPDHRRAVGARGGRLGSGHPQRAVRRRTSDAPERRGLPRPRRPATGTRRALRSVLRVPHSKSL
ncbi:MFS transporter [Mycobacterium sp. B14F4]|uniref:MFS transporter n=1 Tax=Mycobacterium sp. B14F4 TaxID=3153565 RepID=UPI00325ED780